MYQYIALLMRTVQAPWGTQQHDRIGPMWSAPIPRDLCMITCYLVNSHEWNPFMRSMFTTVWSVIGHQWSHCTWAIHSTLYHLIAVANHSITICYNSSQRSKVFSRGQVRALCRTFWIPPHQTGKPCPYWAGSIHLGRLLTQFWIVSGRICVQSVQGTFVRYEW